MQKCMICERTLYCKRQKNGCYIPNFAINVISTSVKIGAHSFAIFLFKLAKISLGRKINQWCNICF